MLTDFQFFSPLVSAVTMQWGKGREGRKMEKSGEGGEEVTEVMERGTGEVPDSALRSAIGC